MAAPDRLIWIVVGAIVVWGIWAFGSELMLNLRLNHEVQSLREGNAQLAVLNAETSRQLGVASSPGAMEEAARKQGFTRAGEQVYVIVKPSPAVAQPSAAPSSAAPASKQVGGVVSAVEKWWQSLWH
ncbi:MAG: septum formation initiator family protein [Candidatus Dormibacteraeota bacterium]|nr:septum formation initiator family protein [Candidatus Dormibacteraeota bacterium]